MDVKRIESVTVPTALAAVAAGTAGYIIPKAITKEGELTIPFLTNTAVDMYKKDAKLMREADKLDKFIKTDEVIKESNPVIDLEAVKPTEAEIYRRMNKDGVNYGEAERRVIKDKFEVEKAVAEEAFGKIKTEVSEAEQKAVQKFVRRNAKAFDIKPKEGQTLSDAVKEFVKGKSAAEIKELFLPAAKRELMKNTDYYEFIRGLFDNSYDFAAKKFKSDEASQAFAKIFKSAERNMKLKVAGVWAGTAGAIALASSFIAERISNR